MLKVIFFALYQALQLLFLPIFVPYTIIKNIHAQTASSIISEQTGFVTQSDRSKHVIWIHGLSAGEISPMQEFVTTLKKEIPNSACYITSATEEGKKTAHQQLACDYVSLLPHDDILAMSVAFERINPKAIILLEHEIKPNLIMLAHLKSIPLYVLNAQYTSQTKTNLQDYGLLYQPVLNLADIVFAQSNQDKQAFINAGISEDKIKPIGNIKAFNVLPKQKAAQKNVTEFITSYQAKKNKPLVMLVGSVHKGEVDHYIKLMQELKPQFPSLKLILAPRYFDWKPELEEKLKQTNYPYVLMDKPEQCPQDPAAMLSTVTDLLADHDIISVCLMGKLFYLHAITDLYFLGGTFFPVGGHNLFEPTAWGNPTILGPNYENTKDIADELKALNAVVQVTTEQELIEAAKTLLNNSGSRIEMGQKAGQWLTNEAERVTKNLDVLLSNLKEHTITQEIAQPA